MKPRVTKIKTDSQQDSARRRRRRRDSPTWEEILRPVVAVLGTKPTLANPVLLDRRRFRR
jgi:hypothetical protein